MQFRSDNAGPVHPSVLAALGQANSGYAPSYGTDALTARVTERVRALFEAPEAAVYLVPTGTSANALLLATMARPWQAIFSHEVAHVAVDECGAPVFFADGATLITVGGKSGKMSPEALQTAMSATGNGDVHAIQPGPATITQVTETGQIYQLSEIRALYEVTRGHGQKLHMDGSRFSNAIAASGATPAEMTWKSGVSALSFGGTKNGLMGAECAILFDPESAWEFELRRKRSAHLFSKHRYLAAQFDAYLTDDLWLETARAANANMARLVDGLSRIPGVGIVDRPAANMLYLTMSRRAHRAAFEAGALYELAPFYAPLDGDMDEILKARLVCDWSLEDAEIDRFIALVAQVA